MPILGYKQLDRQLRALTVAAGGRALRASAMAAMLPVQKQARASAPVRQSDKLKRTYKGRKVTPGFLSRSIKRRSFLSRDKRSATAVVGVAPEAFYGIQFIEFGTSRIPARPWLEPAFRSQLDKVDTIFRRRLKKRIDASWAHRR